MTSIREQILAANDLQCEPIDLPEWGSPAVDVWTLTGTERDDFEASLIEKQGKKMVQTLENVRSKLAVRCLRDRETKKPIFTEEDIEALGNKSCAPLQRIFEVAQRLNKLTDEDLEELTKNSEAGPSAGSTSG